jgi:hypothetical protein
VATDDGARRYGGSRGRFDAVEGNSFTLSKSLKERKVWHFIYFYPSA